MVFGEKKKEKKTSEKERKGRAKGRLCQNTPKAITKKGEEGNNFAKLVWHLLCSVKSVNDLMGKSRKACQRRRKQEKKLKTKIAYFLAYLNMACTYIKSL